METFGEMLGKRREELAISTQEALRALLARAGVNVSANTMSAWHTGRSAPRAGKLVALLDVLQIPHADRARWRSAAFSVAEQRAEAA